MKKILLISLLLSCKLFAFATFDIFAYALKNNLKPVAISVFKHIDQQEQGLAQRTFARKHPGEDVAALATQPTPTTALSAELTAAMRVAGNDADKALAGFRVIMLSPTGSGRAVISQLRAAGKATEVEAILAGRG